MNDNELILKAKEATKNAYVPYSKFRVGAAVLTTTGEVFTGCNIENISFGATNCAERTAIFKGISEGFTQFSKIAVVSSSDEPAFKHIAGDETFPCGICRQVLAEFMYDGDVILENIYKEIKTYKVSDFLPNAFK